MTKEEARLLFSPSDGEFEDYFEDQLFEFKQYFLSKPPIRKLYQSKLGKLQQLEEAYCALGYAVNSNFYELNTFVYSDDVKDAFFSWEKVRGDFKLKLLRATCYSDIANLTEELLNQYEAYTKLWVQTFEVNEAKVSLEPDPMMLVEAIQDFNQSGYACFKDLAHLNDDNPLLNESKRLTLLSKMNESNG